MGRLNEYGVDEIDSEDISLIDLETGLPLIVNITKYSEKIELKEGDRIKATVLPALCSDGTPNCFAFKEIKKL